MRGGPRCARSRLDEHYIAAAKEDEEISATIRVEVHDRSRTFAGRGIKIFNEIYLIVEIPIGLAANQRALGVVLADITPTIVVGVSKNFGQVILDIVDTPDVRPSIVVQILGHYRIAVRPVADER